MRTYFILFTLLTFAIIALSYFFWDQPIEAYFHAHASTTLTAIAKFITFWGDALPYLIVFSLLVAFFYYVKRYRFLLSRVLYLLATVIASGLICDVLKIIFDRSRPVLWFEQQIYGFHIFSFKWQSLYHSFPSGHATTIASVMMGLYLLWPRYRYLYLLAVILVAASRLVLEAHFLSDVMAGAYLGALVSGWLYNKFSKKI